MIVSIIGGGSQAKVTISLVRQCGWKVLSIYDDNRLLHGQRVFGVEVVGPLTDLICNEESCQYVVAIGVNSIRKNICSLFYYLRWEKIVSPFSYVDPTSAVGPGSVIMPGVTIQPSVVIENHCIINTNASVDHDCILKNFCQVAPGATLCGNVILGECSYVGAGSVIKQGITIGNNVMIGAGSVVVKDIPDNVTVFGNPACIIKQGAFT